MEDLISVIMSTYNESTNEIIESVKSILNQSYKNIEFIIVIDNPDNIELISCLNEFEDSRIRLIKNNENCGLVKSLNKAISVSKGKYIVRMDADDISNIERIDLQKKYMDDNKLDLVGGSIYLIDENDNFISKQHFPCHQFLIRLFMKWGSCIPHPTWLVKKEVYNTLGGYRDVPKCEDYDFICRALQTNFKIGNVDEYILKYRIRPESVSNSNKGAQYLLRKFISDRRKTGVSEQEILAYLESSNYCIALCEYEKFQKLKMEFKRHPNVKNIISLLFNTNTYHLGIEKISLKIRNIV